MIAARGFIESRPSAVLRGTSSTNNHRIGGQKARLADSLRPCHARSSAARSVPALAVKEEILNREDELRKLDALFNNVPTDVFFLVGPRNSGKTRLLEEVKANRELSQATQGEGPPPILYLDCREKDVTSPQEFANVIRKLVTEESGLTDWWGKLGNAVAAGQARSKCLEGLLTEDQYIVQVIGDLANMNEAKKFVESRMACGAAPKSFLETVDGEQIDMWPRVYEICGASIGLLERCAQHAKRLGSWEEGLEEVSKNSMGKVKKGFRPGAFLSTGSRFPVAWKKEDYRTVLREIALAKEHKHAVSFDKLQDLVGEEAMMSMAERNLVALRPKSRWAKDVPDTVFTYLNDDKVVTMPSPVSLYFVLKMHAAGELDEAPKKKEKTPNMVNLIVEDK